MSLTLTTESYSSVNKSISNYGIDSLVRTTTPYSYIIESMTFCNELDKIINDSKESLYKTILESNGDEEIITEGMKDFSTTLNKLIESFVEHIRSMFDNFIILMGNAMGKDKNITENRDRFRKFDPNDKFSINGYNYTFDPNIPKAEEEDFSILPYLFNIKSTTDQIKNIDDEINKYKSNKNEYIEKALKSITGIPNATDINYKELLNKQFRNGDNKKQDIDVDYNYINETIIRFLGYKNDVHQLNKTKESVISSYKIDTSKLSFNIRSDFTTSNASSYASDRSKENEAKLKETINRAITVEIEFLKQYMSYHSTAFALKLTAMKESYIQDRAVLYKALSLINKGGPVTAQSECADCGCEDNLGFSVTIDTMEKLDPTIDPEPEDMIDIVISDDDTKNPVEIPVKDGDIDKEKIEESLKTLNAIEFQEITEKVNTAIADKELASLIKIESANNSHFGEDILSNIYANRIRNLSEECMEADKAVCMANNDAYQSIFTGNENNPVFGVYDVLIRADDLYIKQINDRLKDLSDPTLNDDKDYVSEAMEKFIYIESLINSSDHTRFINECLTLASNKPSDVVLKELKSLNEDAMENFQNAIDKIKEFFVTAWDTFIKRVKYFFDNNKKYLENNHDTIVTKKPNFSVNMKDFPTGIANIKNVKIPAFDLNQLSNVLDSEEEFQNYIMKNTKPGLKPGDDFATYCINAFTGGPDEKSVNGSELNMQNIYDYCHTYNEMQNTLSEDQRNILSSLDTQKRQIIKNINTAKTNKANGTTPQDTSGSEPAAQPPKDTKNEGYIYTEVYGYISEVEIIKSQETDQQKADDKAKAEKEKQSAGPESQADIDKNKVNANDANSVKKAASVYNSVVKTVFASKMKAAEEIYNDYMKIIKTHVDNNKEK